MVFSMLCKFEMPEICIIWSNKFVRNLIEMVHTNKKYGKIETTDCPSNRNQKVGI